MHSKTKISLLLILVVAIAGCNNHLPKELADLADDRSVERLAALPEGSGLLLSLHSDEGLGEVPNLQPAGRELGRFGSTALVVVNREMVPALAEVEGVTGMVLWGDDNAVNKIDPMLRNELLSGMDAPNWQERKHSVIGIFTERTQELRQTLENKGAAVGSINGNIATLEATSETVFDLLTLDDLQQLKKPDLLRPAHGLK